MGKEKRIVFLRGTKVNLRPYYKETDLLFCTRCINDPDVRVWLDNVWPITAKREEEILDEITSGKDKNSVFLIVETKEGKQIGVMGLFKINGVNRTATSGAFIGEKEYWGGGYGTDAKLALLDHAFNTLNLQKVCSNVIAFNKRSLAYNRKCGYKVEGIRRKQWFRHGRYFDEIVMAVFKKDFARALWRYRKKGAPRARKK